MLRSLIAAGPLLCAAAASASVGLAEWSVYTPGGHQISRNDRLKDRHGTCLHSDTTSTSSKPTVFVSHLKRWRYFEGHVVGESRSGFFLFDENSRKVTPFGSEKLLLSALKHRRIVRALSAWLAAGDGWREAWYPFMVWRPCKDLLRSKDRAARTAIGGMSRAECTRALSPARLTLYRRTTWGRECRRLQQSKAQADPALTVFCREIMGKGR